MGRYFGTDGFRGEAGVVLTAAAAYKIGRFLGYLAVHEQADAHTHGPAHGDERVHTIASHPRVLLGKDPRRSGYMFEAALSAGLLESGVDVYQMHVTTTPSVAYITRKEDFAFGIMVSASHNSFQDNGIKILNSQGEKLDEDTIARIEDFIDAPTDTLPRATGELCGRARNHEEAQERYAGYLISLAQHRFSGYRVALDCANGSAYALGPKVFDSLGAETYVINASPNGVNINRDCGSTHIEALCSYVKENGLDVGFAFDGDADRCLAVDHEGNVVNGDQLMYAAAVHLKKTGELANNTLVTTVMSNFGLYKALDAAGIAYEKTDVGDKFVWENMSRNGHVLGGEQSGHIIFGQHARTGDGILTAVMIMDVLIDSGLTLKELVEPCRLYPQVLKNVAVDDKESTLNDSQVKGAVEAATQALGDDGRVLVRKSGTELLIRVMAEAGTEEAAEEQVDAIIATIASAGHVEESAKG